MFYLEIIVVVVAIPASIATIVSFIRSIKKENSSKPHKHINES